MKKRSGKFTANDSWKHRVPFGRHIEGRSDRSPVLRGIVVTKTWNDLKPPTATYNHLKKIQQPPTTIYNHLKNIYNHSQTI